MHNQLPQISLKLSQLRIVRHHGKALLLSSVPVDAGPELGLTTRRGRTVTHGKTLNKIVVAHKLVCIKVKWYGEARYK